MTLRTLEVLACDGFLMSDRVPVAEKLLGDYVAFTNGHEDLRRQIRHYLAHPDARQRMARAGGAFVRENFSIRATARKLLDYLRSLGP
jgi:spore maturation protein CgeB